MNRALIPALRANSRQIERELEAAVDDIADIFERMTRLANVNVTIEGVFGLDGEWPIDTTYFTNRELHEIKKISGVRAGELSEALEAGDSDLIVCIAHIALARHGKTVPIDALWEAEAGKISFETVEQEVADEAVPPQPAQPESASGDGSNGFSGAPSKPTGDLPASDPSPTGTPV
jgi:hypothetical protein